MFEFPTTPARPVWIASYPRSGNTFLRILLEKAFELISFSVYYVEGATHIDPSAEALENAPKLPGDWRRRLTNAEAAPLVAIKTHDLPSDNAPAIFIARDGRAAIHSYFHYHKKFAFEQPTLTEVIAGACQFGSWSEHYWGWRPKSRPNTLLLQYDELVTCPELVIEKVAAFLKRAPKHTNVPEFSELQQKLPTFFRRGKNNDFLNEWSPGQLRLFDVLHHDAMADLGWSVAPEQAESDDALRELAACARRLHRQYLEQLTNVGISQEQHRRTLKDLEEQSRRSGAEIDAVLRTLLSNRWVRLGIGIGAVAPPAQPLPHEPAPAGATPPPATSEIKSSDENTRSSSPGPQANGLSAPTEGTSARA